MIRNSSDMFCLVHTAIGGILAGEQMVRQISTVSVISRNDIASAKQVRRAKEKGLISVFLEAMSHVASKMRRVYRAEIMRNKSGRVSGARVGYIEIISRSVCSYISALPQYLERDARGMRTPCATQIFPKTANKVSAQVGSVLCGAQIKRNKHPLWSA